MAKELFCYKCNKKITIGSKTGLCKSCSVKARPKNWSFRRKNNNKITKDFLTKQYILKKQSITQIAKECNENYGYTRRKLLEFGIFIRKPWENKSYTTKGNHIGKKNGNYKNGNYCKETIHYCIEQNCNKKVSNINKRCTSCAAKLRNRLYLKKILRRNTPSNYEKVVIQLINKYSLPYQYVGDGYFMLGRKNPDFVNRGEKKIIEVYGSYQKTRNYGSPEEYEKQRKEYYNKYGYDVIFLNDKDILKKDNMQQCFQKIKEG